MYPDEELNLQPLGICDDVLTNHTKLVRDVFCFLTKALLPGKVGLFHGIERKAFHQLMHERLWCGKTYLGGSLPCVPFPSVLPWKKSNHVFSKARTKASVQSSCAMLRLVQFSLSHHPASLACVPGCNTSPKLPPGAWVGVHAAVGYAAAKATWPWRENVECRGECR